METTGGISWTYFPLLLQSPTGILHCLFMHLFMIPWTTAFQASLFFTVSQSFYRFMSIELVMLSNNHLILCLLFLLLPLIFPSSRVFSNESVLCIKWTKYWGFSTSSSNEYLRLTSFSIDCMQLSQEAGKVVWYSNIFKNFLYLLWSTQSKALV